MLLRCKNVVLYSPDPPPLKGEGGGSGYETRHYLTVRNFCLTISRMSLGHRGPWTDPSRLINICTRTKTHILLHTYCYIHKSCEIGWYHLNIHHRKNFQECICCKLVGWGFVMINRLLTAALVVEFTNLGQGLAGRDNLGQRHKQHST